jgi:hypothetical protein
MPRLALPPWLRRGLESAAVAAVVAVATLYGNRLSAGSSAYALPDGPLGALVLAPAVLALGVVPSAYPLTMAATRSDAIFGAMAGFLIAADVTVVFSPQPVLLGPAEQEIAGGLLVALLALPAAAFGLLGGQFLTPLGFGRRAGAIAATVAGAVALIVLVVVAIAR